MPRIARKDIKTSFLHVMVQGINKEYIFDKEKYIQIYLQIFNNYQKDFNLTLIAYCIMNNHAHFLIHADDIKDIGKYMHKVNLIYTIKYNELNNRTGVLFRNRYKSEPIYDRKYLLNCIKYIHNNPVKANIVEECGDYKYSSYNDYSNNTGIAKNKILEDIFGKDCNYLFLFKKGYDKIFMDVDEEKDFEHYIKERNKGIFK